MSHAKQALNPYDDPTSIGNLAVTLGYATREDIMKALKEQEQRLPLGEILVFRGVISKDQLEELLHLQEVERTKNQSEATKLVLRRQQSKAREAVSVLQEATAVMRLFVANGKRSG